MTMMVRALIFLAIFFASCEFKRDNPADESSEGFVSLKILTPSTNSVLSSRKVSVVIATGGDITLREYQIAQGETVSSYHTFDSDTLVLDSLEYGKHQLVIHIENNVGREASDTISFEVIALGNGSCMMSIIENSLVQITCSDGSSIVLRSGIDGTNGTDGEDGLDGTNGKNGKDGIDGISCTAKTSESGLKQLVCDDGSSFVIQDGVNGTNGTNGADGASCSVSNKKDGTATISCEDGTSATLLQGPAGKDGKTCSVITNPDNTRTLSCTDGTFVLVRDGIDGKDGTNGNIGSNGTDGKDGIDGSDGKDGANGKNFFSGHGVPISVLGTDGDSYLNIDSGDLYIKASNVWSKEGSLLGPAGENGTNGTNGTDGKNLLSGKGNPLIAQGKDGESYLDIETETWWLKISGAWTPQSHKESFVGWMYAERIGSSNPTGTCVAGTYYWAAGDRQLYYCDATGYWDYSGSGAPQASIGSSNSYYWDGVGKILWIKNADFGWAIWAQANPTATQGDAGNFFWNQISSLAWYKDLKLGWIVALKEHPTPLSSGSYCWARSDSTYWYRTSWIGYEWIQVVHGKPTNTEGGAGVFVYDITNSSYYYNHSDLGWILGYTASVSSTKEKWAYLYTGALLMNTTGRTSFSTWAIPGTGIPSTLANYKYNYFIDSLTNELYIKHSMYGWIRIDAQGPTGIISPTGTYLQINGNTSLWYNHAEYGWIRESTTNTSGINDSLYWFASTNSVSIYLTLAGKTYVPLVSSVPDATSGSTGSYAYLYASKILYKKTVEFGWVPIGNDLPTTNAFPSGSIFYEADAAKFWYLDEQRGWIWTGTTVPSISATDGTYYRQSNGDLYYRISNSWYKYVTVFPSASEGANSTNLYYAPMDSRIYKDPTFSWIFFGTNLPTNSQIPYGAIFYESSTSKFWYRDTIFDWILTGSTYPTTWKYGEKFRLSNGTRYIRNEELNQSINLVTEHPASNFGSIGEWAYNSINDSMWFKNSVGWVKSSTIVDQRNNTKYRWVEVGSQRFFRSYLKYTPSSSDGVYISFSKVNPDYPIYPYYVASQSANNDSRFVGKIGVCPDGWHVPSELELKYLGDYVTSASGNSLYTTMSSNFGILMNYSSLTNSGTGYSAFNSAQSVSWNINSPITPTSTNNFPVICEANTKPLVQLAASQSFAQVGNGLVLFAHGANTPESPAIQDWAWNVDGGSFASLTGAGTFTWTPTSAGYHKLVLRGSDGINFAYDTIAIYAYANVITDARDNQMYPIVTLGSQTWMARDLNFTPTLAAGYFPTILSAGPSFYAGQLYSSGTLRQNAASSAATPSGVQGICPSGFHIPSQTEWNTLNSWISSNRGTYTAQQATTVKFSQSGNYGEDLWGLAFIAGNSSPSPGSVVYHSATLYNASNVYNETISGATISATSSVDFNSYYPARCLKD